MNWFQRYGIPGAYFEGMAILLLIIYYPSLCNENDLKLIGGVFTASFLPIGYILTMFSQCMYWLRTLLFDKGPHIRSSNKAQVSLKGATSEIKAAAYSTLNVFVPRLNKYDKDRIERHRFVQEWITKRVDVIVMNETMICGTIFLLLLIPFLYFIKLLYLLPHLIFKPAHLLIFLYLLIYCSVSIIIVVIFLINIIINRIQIETLISGTLEEEGKQSNYTKNDNESDLST